MSALSDLLAQPFLLKPNAQIIGEDHLPDAPNPPNPVPGMRLGHYVEALLEHAISARGLPYASGIPVRRGKETLGELDFVFQNPDGSWEHWEVAYKLYVNRGHRRTTHTHQDYVGPEGRDRLDLKLHRFLSHQLPLAKTPEAIAAIHSRIPAFDPENMRSRIWLKGRIFSTTFEELPTELGFHANTLQGLWQNSLSHGIRLKKLEVLNSKAPDRCEERITPTERPQWIWSEGKVTLVQAST